MSRLFLLILSFCVFFTFSCTSIKQPTSTFALSINLKDELISMNILNRYSQGIKSTSDWQPIGLTTTMIEVPLDLKTRSTLSKAAVPTVTITKEVIKLVPTKIKIGDKKVKRWTSGLFPILFYTTVPIYNTVMKEVKEIITVVKVPAIPPIYLDPITGTYWTEKVASHVDQIINVNARARTMFTPDNILFKVSKEKNIFIEVTGQLSLMIDIDKKDIVGEIKGLYSCEINKLKVSTHGKIQFKPDGEIELSGFESNINASNFCTPEGMDLITVNNLATTPLNMTVTKIFNELLNHELSDQIYEMIEINTGKKLFELCKINQPVEIGDSEWFIPNIKSYHIESRELDEDFSLKTAFRFKPELAFSIEEPKFECRDIRVHNRNVTNDSTYLWLNLSLKRDFLEKEITNLLNNQIDNLGKSDKAHVVSSIVKTKGNNISIYSILDNNLPISGRLNFGLKIKVAKDGNSLKYILTNVNSNTNRSILDFGVNTFEFLLLGAVNLLIDRKFDPYDEEEFLDFLANVKNINIEAGLGKLNGGFDNFKILNVSAGKDNSINLIVSLSGILKVDVGDFPF